MKLNKTAATLLLLCAASTAQAANIDLAINVGDSNNDTFVGTAVYDTGLDIFTSVSGTFTYADGIVSSNVFPYNINTPFASDGGTLIAGIFFGPPAVWVDAVSDGNNPNGFLAFLLDTSPSMPNPTLDPRAYILDDTGAQHPITNFSMTAVPEPASIALLASGLFGLGLSRRKSIK